MKCTRCAKKNVDLTSKLINANQKLEFLARQALLS